MGAPVLLAQRSRLLGVHLALPGASMCVCVLRPADNVQHMISKKKPYDYVGDK